MEKGTRVSFEYEGRPKDGTVVKGSDPVLGLLGKIEVIDDDGKRFEGCVFKFKKAR